MKYLIDVIGLIGLGLFGYGISLVHIPSSFIAVGSLLMLAAYKASK